MRLYLNRSLGAALPDVKLQQEIAAEPRFLNQAWISVLVWPMLASWGSFGRAGAAGACMTGWVIGAITQAFLMVTLFQVFGVSYNRRHPPHSGFEH